MKSSVEREKALALYLKNLSWENIGKELNLGERTVRDWATKYNWREIRERTIQETAKKAPEKYQQIIQDEVNITDLANKELLKRLTNQEAIRAQIQQLLNYLKELNIKNDKDAYYATVNAVQGLSKEMFFNKDLIMIEKHGLDVIRPSETKVNALIQNNTQVNQVDYQALLEKVKRDAWTKN